MGFPLRYVGLALYEDLFLAILVPRVCVWIQLSSFQLSNICDTSRSGLT